MSTRALAQNRAAEIKRLHQEAQESAMTAVQKVLQAGKLLAQAKADVPHGGWLPFLDEAGMNARTAQRYMKLAKNEHLLKNDTVSHLSVTKALELVTEPSAEEPGPEERRAMLKEIEAKMEKASRKPAIYLAITRHNLGDDRFNAWMSERFPDIDPVTLFHARRIYEFKKGHPSLATESSLHF